MMTNRFSYAVAAIAVAFLLVGCQTAQKSGGPATATPSTKAESPKDLSLIHISEPTRPY